MHTPKAQPGDGEDGDDGEEGGGAAGPREAVVVAHLSTLDSDEGQGRRLEIQRSCNTRGTCEYRVNGRRVTWEAYRGELQRAGVLCNSSIKSYSVDAEVAGGEEAGDGGEHQVVPLCGSSCGHRRRGCIG